MTKREMCYFHIYLNSIYGLLSNLNGGPEYSASDDVEEKFDLFPHNFSCLEFPPIKTDLLLKTH